MVDMRFLTPIDEIDRGDPTDRLSLGELAEAAQNYLLNHRWCHHINRGFLGMGYEGIIGVFYFEILPAKEDVDRELWVVVGDVPPAYLVCDDSPDPASALEAYLSQMEAWVEAVDTGKPVDDLIPVNAPHTKEYANMLRSRLDFLQRKILPDYRAGLSE